MGCNYFNKFKELEFVNGLFVSIQTQSNLCIKWIRWIMSCYPCNKYVMFVSNHSKSV